MKRLKSKHSNNLILYFSSLLLGVVVCSCAKPPDDPTANGASRYLYMSSGMCQAGSNTTFTTLTASNRVIRINLNTGLTDSILADYNSPPATTGDSPVGIAPFDSDNIMVVIERSGARRLEKVPKSAYATRIPFSNDTTSALTNTLLGMVKTPDNGYIISRTNGTAKISSSGLTQVATFMTNNPGGSCGTANNKYAALAATSFGHLFFANSAASNNKIGIIKNSGSTCLGGLAAPSATAFPSAAVFIPGYEQIIVAYAGSAVTTDLNSLYVYSVTEDANTASLSAGTKIYDAASYPGTYPYLLYGVSAMAFDATDNSLYVATAITTTTKVAQYNIEKFTYDPVNKTLVRSSSPPFISYSLDTKCISGLFVDN